MRSESPQMYGGTLVPNRLPWTWATHQLQQSRIYWIATTRPDGRPHCRPVWGIWLDDVLYFGTGSRAVQNLATSSAISVHLESGVEVVILEGDAQEVIERHILERIAPVYTAKYNEPVDIDKLPGPFFAVIIERAYGWIVEEGGTDGGAVFHATATRWTPAEVLNPLEVPTEALP